MLNEFDLSRTDLNLLVVFAEVFEHRHVGRAATALSLSPSAVSHALGRLRRLFDDPLFLRTARGVVPTDRALALVEPVNRALADLRAILGNSVTFDPQTSRRRFMLGAPDGISATLLPGLIARLAAAAPGVELGAFDLLPDPGESVPERAWRSALARLDERAIDLAILPLDPAPARFVTVPLLRERFVIAMRRGHPLSEEMNLEAFCAADHLLVSQSGDFSGFVDTILAGQGRTRRVAATAPTFLLALSLLSGSDLIAALPRRFAALHADRFGVVALEPPLDLGSFQVNAVMPGRARADHGLAWFADMLEHVAAAGEILPDDAPGRPPLTP